MAGPSMYITEPPCRGKVVLHTSYGDVDIELWPKEAPVACRNFVQLALEGYYDGQIFHRIIKDLLIQTGSPSGLGDDGESIFGKDNEGYFKDEFHQRLKFNHRGQLAMANSNTPGTNLSQWFITLANKCDWLDKKHTIFGKVTGNTIFNVLRMGECEVDKEDRPLEPPRLLSIEVQDNPFDDIVPRTVARAAAKAAADRQAEEAAKTSRSARAIKASNLLSFGGDEEEEEEEEGMAPKAKFKSASSVAPASKSLSAFETSEEDRELVLAAQQQRGASGGKRPSSAASAGAAAVGADEPGGEDDDFGSGMVSAMRQKRAKYETAPSTGKGCSASTPAPAPAPSASTNAAPAQSEGAAEYARLRAELVEKRRAAHVLTGPALDKAKADAADASLLTPLQLMRSKYARRGDTSSKARENSTLDKLAAFQATLKAAATASSSAGGAAAAASSSSSTEHYHGQVMEDDGPAPDEAGGASSASWMAHRLKFKRHIDDAFRAGHDDGLVTIDTADEGGRGQPGGAGERHFSGPPRPGDRERRPGPRSEHAAHRDR